MVPDERTPSIPAYPTESKESRHHTLSKHQREPPNNDDKVREFLAKCTVILMILDLSTYLITRDITVLLGGTIIAVAVGLVFQYYFKRQK